MGIDQMERTFSFDELHELHGIKVPTWRKWAATGKIPVVRFGRRVRVKESDVQKLMDSYGMNNTELVTERDLDEVIAQGVHALCDALNQLAVEVRDASEKLGMALGDLADAMQKRESE